MDKKKVIKQLEQAINAMLKYNATFEDRYRTRAFNLVQDAQREIRKSDWVSVEDRLPPLEEVVNVRIDCGEGGNELNEHIITYGSTHRVKSKDNCSHLRFDKNNFVIDYDFETITHWKPIEKLEDL